MADQWVFFSNKNVLISHLSREAGEVGREGDYNSGRVKLMTRGTTEGKTAKVRILEKI